MEEPFQSLTPTPTPFMGLIPTNAEAGQWRLKIFTKRKWITPPESLCQCHFPSCISSTSPVYQWYPHQEMFQIFVYDPNSSYFLYMLSQPAIRYSAHCAHCKATEDPTFTCTSPSAWGSVALPTSSWYQLELTYKACFVSDSKKSFRKIPTGIKQQL